jgi:hypothetical protein
MGKDRLVTLEDVKAIAETDLAVLCIIESDEVWVPQSQIDEDSEVFENGTEGTLIVTRWWAEKKGLV